MVVPPTSRPTKRGSIMERASCSGFVAGDSFIMPRRWRSQENPLVGKIRNPKPEIRNKSEIRISQCRHQQSAPASICRFEFSALDLEFVSDFWFWISSFLRSTDVRTTALPGGALPAADRDRLQPVFSEAGWAEP